MKLQAQKRTLGTKGDRNKFRREGHIPAILYGKGQKEVPLYVKAEEIKTILRNTKQGLLATTMFDLHGEGKALIKDIQYHVTSYEIEHIDFLVVSENTPVTVNVPVQVTGAADCAGVKLGGFIRQVVRTVPVRCLPRHIPQEFTVDVRDLGVGQSLTMSNIAVSSHVQLIAKDMNAVVVAIGKKAGTA